MDDYLYSPEDEDYMFEQKEDIPETEGGSTLIQELDEVEFLNRNADEFSKIKTEDNPYPDVLRKPLYTSVVPEGGTINSRTQQLTSEANNNYKEPKTLMEMSLKEFFQRISSSVLEIINDLLAFDFVNFRKDQFFDIFTKEERLVSLGILLIIISVFLLFFK